MILVVLLGLLTGCRIVVIHPIEGKDIVRIKANTNYIPKEDGWFFTDYYVKEVMDAKIRK